MLHLLPTHPHHRASSAGFVPADGAASPSPEAAGAAGGPGADLLGDLVDVMGECCGGHAGTGHGCWLEEGGCASERVTRMCAALPPNHTCNQGAAWKGDDKRAAADIADATRAHKGGDGHVESHHTEPQQQQQQQEPGSSSEARDEGEVG
jgi:hypothetical protein